MAATAPRPAPEPVTEGRRRAPRATRLRKRGRAAASAGCLKESRPRPRSVGSAPHHSPIPLETSPGGGARNASRGSPNAAPIPAAPAGPHGTMTEQRTASPPPRSPGPLEAPLPFSSRPFFWDGDGRRSRTAPLPSRGGGQGRHAGTAPGAVLKLARPQRDPTQLPPDGH